MNQYDSRGSRERDAILGLVSGRAKPQRDGCWLAMLQVYADDSGSSKDQGYFALAGFVANVHQWTAFSDDWRQALDRDDLPYFKSSDAAWMTGPFEKGWTRALVDQKVDELSEIVARHVQYRVHAIVRWDDFNKYIGDSVSSLGHLLPEFMNPYMLLFYSLGGRMARFMHDNGIDEELEYIFDDQGTIGDNAVRLISGVQSLGKLINGGFGGIPSFKSDKIVVPLQAADLLAYHVRDYALEGTVVPSRAPSVKRTILDIPKAVGWRVGAQQLADYRRDLFAAAIKMEHVVFEAAKAGLS